jgi:hypothetical protein
VSRYTIQCKETGRYWNPTSGRFVSVLNGDYKTYLTAAIALRAARQLANRTFRDLRVVADPVSWGAL